MILISQHTGPCIVLNQYASQEAAQDIFITIGQQGPVVQSPL